MARHRQTAGTQAYMFPGGYIASVAAVSRIKVYIDDRVGGWVPLIQQALDEWNNPQLESAVHIDVVPLSAGADCVLGTYVEDDGYMGYASPPDWYSKAVGNNVLINTLYFSQGYDEYDYYNCIVHEMGHAMGLAHSGGEDPSFSVPDILIPNTHLPADPDDLMYTSVHPWKGFSADEVQAIRTLWPDAKAA